MHWLLHSITSYQSHQTIINAIVIFIETFFLLLLYSKAAPSRILRSEPPAIATFKDAAPVELAIAEVDEEAPSPSLEFLVAVALGSMPEFNAEILAVLTEYADPVTVVWREIVCSMGLTTWLAVGADWALD